MSQKQNRVGEQRLNNSGELMTIVEYRNNKDIDIEFEDGRIAEHMAYSHFVKGDINGLKGNTVTQKVRIGSILPMNNGLKCEVIEYCSSRDITVRFLDNGYEAKSSWDSFMRGEIGCYDKDGNAVSFSTVQRMGMKKENFQELMMKIIVYRNSSDIDVEFENGVVVQHVIYSNFLRGEITCPGVSLSKNAKTRLGEKRNSKNGQTMEIIDYYNWNNIKIRFEDGTEVETTYGQFKTGKVRNPNYDTILERYKRERVGYTAVMNNGLALTVVEYKKTSDVVAVFEDGTKVNTNFQAIQKGSVGHPMISKSSVSGFYGFKGRFAFESEPQENERKRVYFLCVCSKCGYKDILTAHDMMEHNCC